MIPDRARKEVAKRRNVCERKGDSDHLSCGGRLTWEHALYYKGKQVQESWAIIKICEKAHNLGRWQNGGDLNKRRNKEIALNRATKEDLSKYPRNHWGQYKK